jgi:predicted lipoprotein with Yx(FWY)xxD motif
MGDDPMRAAMISTMAAMALLAGTHLAAAQATAPAKTADTTKGKVLVDAKGMTLYTFDKDSAGKSACNGPCAENWPPLMAAADAKGSGDWTVVKRDDGKTMWAYKGKPLYTWVKDKAPGDTTGDGVNNNLWHVAKP